MVVLLVLKVAFSTVHTRAARRCAEKVVRSLATCPS